LDAQGCNVAPMLGCSHRGAAGARLPLRCGVLAALPLIGLAVTPATDAAQDHYQAGLQHTLAVASSPSSPAQDPQWQAWPSLHLLPGFGWGSCAPVSEFEFRAERFWSSSDIFALPVDRVRVQFQGVLSVMTTEWLVLLAVTAILLVTDFLVVQPLVKGAGFSRHIVALLFWVIVAVLYNLGVAATMGQEAAWMWCAGYLLEWLLSLDNLFVFHLIFKVYNTPKVLLHKALFIGVLGTAIFRMCFFSVLATLLHLVRWVRFIFGAFLIYSGVKAAFEDDEEDPDVKNTFVVRLLTRLLGDKLLTEYDLKGLRLFVRDESGQWRATLLVPVIVCLEVTDIVFAIDSVSAKVAQIPDYYMAYSSSVLAIWGLRSMFFILRDLVDYFDKLKYGLCFILMFIGVELLAADYVNLPPQVVCTVITLVFMISIAASYLTTDGKKPRERNSPDISSLEACEMQEGAPSRWKPKDVEQ